MHLTKYCHFIWFLHASKYGGSSVFMQLWRLFLTQALEDYLAKEAEREADGAARIKAGAKAGGKKKAAKVAKPKKKMDDDDDWAVEKEKPKTQSSRPALAPLGSTSVSASFSAMSKSVSKPTNPPTVTSSMSIKPSPLTLVVSEKKGSPVKQAKKAAPKNVKDRFATSKVIVLDYLSSLEPCEYSAACFLPYENLISQLAYPLRNRRSKLL